MERITPSGLDLYQRFRDRESQRTNWPKGADDENNLYSPVASDGGRHGDFGTEAKSTSPYQKVALSGALKWAIAASVTAAFLVRRANRPRLTAR
jgi:hypothetical protein